MAKKRRVKSCYNCSFSVETTFNWWGEKKYVLFCITGPPNCYGQNLGLSSERVTNAATTMKYIHYPIVTNSAPCALYKVTTDKKIEKREKIKEAEKKNERDKLAKKKTEDKKERERRARIRKIEKAEKQRKREEAKAEKERLRKEADRKEKRSARQKLYRKIRREQALAAKTEAEKVDNRFELMDI